MKKMLITAFITIIAIGVADPFSSGAVLNAQDTTKKTEQVKKGGTKKLSEQELKKQKREERLKKRKTREAKDFMGKFIPTPEKKLEQITAQFKDIKTLDLNFGDLFLLKNMYVRKNEKGESILYVVVNILDSKTSMYDFQVKFLDKNGKSIHEISVPIYPYGRNLRKGTTLAAQFKIDDWAGKYDSFDVAFLVPVEPVLKVNDKNSATIK